MDVTDARFFISQKPDKPPPTPPATGDRGQPGFTENERMRFNALLEEANLVDVWRHLHGAERDYSWRGHPGVSTVGRFRGHGMRIDHHIVPRSLLPRVRSCEFSTAGFELAQLVHRHVDAFFGSDHCALTLTLAPDNGKEEAEEEEEEGA